MFSLIFLVLSIVLFVLAGLNLPAPNPPRWNLGWFGLASLAVWLAMSHGAFHG